MNDCKCPIWSTDATCEDKKGHYTHVVFSSRAGGEYIINDSGIQTVKDLDSRQKARLTTWLIDQRKQGEECPRLDDDTIQTFKDTERKRDLPVHDRADRLLKYIGQQVPQIGEPVEFPGEGQRLDEMLAWSESTGESELDYLREFLHKKNWLDEKNAETHDDTDCVIVTVEGYTR